MSTHVVRNVREDYLTSAPTLEQIEIQCAIEHVLWVLSLPCPTCEELRELSADGYLYLTSLTSVGK
jgi:hypothetical protein